MEDDPTPPTQPFGDVAPRRKGRKKAIALASPTPVVPPRLPASPDLYDASALQRLIAQTLDLVDSIADSVAEGLGIRAK